MDTEIEVARFPSESTLLSEPMFFSQTVRSPDLHLSVSPQDCAGMGDTHCWRTAVPQSQTRIWSLFARPGDRGVDRWGARHPVPAPPARKANTCGRIRWRCRLRLPGSCLEQTDSVVAYISHSQRSRRLRGPRRARPGRESVVESGRRPMHLGEDHDFSASFVLGPKAEPDADSSGTVLVAHARPVLQTPLTIACGAM